MSVGQKQQWFGNCRCTAEILGCTFDEALALTREAQDCLRGYGGEVSHELVVDIAVHFPVTTMRPTSRLTKMMAWLLVQRAVH